jgi:hypothetical protein
MQRFIECRCDDAGDYETVEEGTYFDSDGDQFGGMPGIVAHDFPAAMVAAEVDGGYMAFDSMDEYRTWANQI